MKSGVQRFVFCYCLACDSKIIYSNFRIEILGEFFEGLYFRFLLLFYINIQLVYLFASYILDAEDK